MVYDSHGNSDSCVAHIVVHDVEPPTIVCPPDVPIVTDQGELYATYDLLHANPAAALADNSQGAAANQNTP
jgi:hypothetical protein